MKIAVIIPAYNEGVRIGPLVSAIIALNYDCIVVDDGSLDDTVSVARQRGAFVLSTAGTRCGKGHALRVGFEYAKDKYDALISMDGDGQHSPSDIATFVDCYENTHGDVICGNRMQNPQGMPWVRLLTNRVMSWIISMICRQSIADTQCGFRLITTHVLKAITLACSDFEIETEVLIKAAKKGFKIKSVAIQSIYGSEISKIKPFKDTWRFLAFLWRELNKR